MSGQDQKGEHAALIRVQRQRTKGWKMPENTVYVGRPSVWGNPWTMTDARTWRIPLDQRAAWLVARYRELMTATPIVVDDIKKRLGGKNLACWCPLDQPCHADALLELANA